ncbi:MAG: phospholipid carrier-dependent glycosyltransferase [Candidatus Limnocylindrales bacterium]
MRRAGASIFPIALLLLAGLALRLIIAYVLFPGSGFKTDLSSFTSWALTLARYGPGGFYANAGFADYTPGYLYILWLVGLVGEALAHLLGADPAAVVGQLIKLPAILVDLAVAYVLYRTVIAWNAQIDGGRRDEGDSPDTGPSPRVRWLALGAAALYLFNPVTWYDSALWGQMDALGALIVLGAILALGDGWSEGAAGLAVLAALVKPQFGLVLSPVVGVVLLRRHLFVPGSGPVPRLRNTRLASWFVDEQGPWRIISSIAAGLAVLFIVIVPFRLDVVGLVRLVLTTAGEYHYLTVNAYNGWALVADPGGASLARAGTWSDDLVPLLGPLPGFAIGAALLLAGIVIGVLQVAWSDSRRSILLAAAFLSLAFFVLPTRVHERYLFPIFMILPLLAVTSRRWLVATVVLAAASFMNLDGILTLPLYATPNIANLAGGPEFRSETGVILSATGHLAVFVLALASLDPIRWLVRRGWRPASERAGDAQRSAPVLALAGSAPAPPDPETIALSSLLVAATPGVPEAAIAPSGASALPPEREWAARPATRWGLGVLRNLLGPGSIRADRSRSLHGEGGGRVDRLDLLVMGLLFVAAMTTRTVGLSQPYGMYFDEIYHARTATEFLQDWRYGMPHSIYEFTHPHLAKYLMAVGLVAFGDDRVTGTSELGVPVRSAAIEPRWGDAGGAAREGDRLYVATGSGVVAYDLQTRGPVARIPVAGASAVAVDTNQHVLYVAAGNGTVWSLPTTTLDALRSTAGGVAVLQPHQLPGPGAGAPVQRLVASSTGATVLAVTTGGAMVSLDAATGAVLGRNSATAQAGTGPVEGVVALDPVPSVTVDLARSPNPSAVSELATALGVASGPIVDLPAAVARGEAAVASASAAVRRAASGGARTASAAQALAAARLALTRAQAQLEAARSQLRPVVVSAFLGSAQQSAIQPALQALGSAAQVGTSSIFAVSGGTVVRFLDASTLDPVASLQIGGSAGGMTLVSTGLDQPTLYIASGTTLRTIQLPSDGQPVLGSPVPMPGQVSDVTWDAASNMVHALGRTPDGSSATIYVVEAHGNAVYANANLPFTPAAWALDQQPGNPGGDRQQLLALSPGGTVAAVDVGSHAFAWRLPGVIAGALLAALLYLLARILFRRRSVGLFVAAFALTDGMFFANSRIGMNDTYSAVFIVAAYVVFAALALGRWRGRSALLVGLPLMGLLLGLACASKWVGFYAVGGIGLLTLLRSGLGRVLALGGMTGLAGILGYYSISAAPGVTSPQLNVTFLLMMILLTLLLAAGLAVRTIHWTADELRFAVWAPLLLGVLAAAGGVLAGPWLSALPISRGGLLAAGLVLVAVAAVAYATPLLLARYRAGPLAPDPEPGEARFFVDPPADPPAESWLVPGATWGIPWLWALACMTLVPLVVYVISYVPWVALGNQFWTGFPPGNHGQTLWELTVSMFNYHNDLRVAHPASSPWWAWPFDLKPVWWYQGSLSNGTGASIYDTGNLVLFWLSVSAVPWVAWQAWRRRSLALGIVVFAAASQWLPWVWVDRATFQYHFLTTLPFTFLALAYFVAELWHGPARRTWALARVSAAIAILGPAIVWLAKGPLCALAGTSIVDPGSQVCGAVANPVIVTQRVAVAALVIVLGAAAAGWFWFSDRRAAWAGEDDRARTLRRVGVAAAVTVVALAVAQSVVPDVGLVSVPLGSGGPLVVAAVVGLVLCGPAWLVLRARDPRRFALGVVVAAALWFVVWYPNISALPLPATFVNMYQGLLPTWIYDFQFTVNMTPAAHPKLLTAGSVALMAGIGIGSVAVLYAVRAWRLELALRRAGRDAGTAAGPAGEGHVTP